MDPKQGHMVHAPLAEAAIGGRLRLGAFQGPQSGTQTPAAKAEVVRLLTGHLDGTAAATAHAVEKQSPTPAAKHQRPAPRTKRAVSELFRPDRLGRGSSLGGGGTEGTRW